MIQNLREYTLLTLTAIFWGSSWVIGKILVELAPPFTLGFFRFLIASVFFITLLLSNKRTFSYQKKDYLHFFILGLTGIFGYGIFFLIGLKFTTASQGAIIAGLNPVTVSIFTHLLHKERLEQKWRYSGFIISFIGVILVIGVQTLLDFRLEYLIGNLIIALAMCIWGLYSALGKGYMNNKSSLETTTGAVLVGTLIFGIGASAEQFWFLDAMTDNIFWIGSLLMGFFVTFLGFYFYFIGIKSIGASKASIFINLVPVFGVLFSFLVLKESLNWSFGVGLILIIIGITIINKKKGINGKNNKKTVKIL